MREPKYEAAAILALDTCASFDGLSPFLWGHHPLGRRKHRFQKDSQEAEEDEGDLCLTSAEYTQTIGEGPDARDRHPPGSGDLWRSTASWKDK